MTTNKDKTIEILGQERRRRWSTEEKLAMVRESLEPGQSVSVVARRNAAAPPFNPRSAVLHARTLLRRVPATNMHVLSIAL